MLTVYISEVAYTYTTNYPQSNWLHQKKLSRQIHNIIIVSTVTGVVLEMENSYNSLLECHSNTKFRFYEQWNINYVHEIVLSIYLSIAEL